MNKEPYIELEGIGNRGGSSNSRKTNLYNESLLIRGLYRYFDECSYRLSNCYIYDFGESDFFFITPSDYACEVEIKCSRADFRADFKKEEKHAELSSVYKDGNLKGRLVPNRFYYCAPFGVIPPEEVPDYAGLIEVTKSGGFKNKIPCPYIHKHKYDMKNILLDKFYSKSIKEEKLINKLRIDMYKTPHDIKKHVTNFLKKIRK